MNINEVITQIRTYAPSFQNRIAGAADFATGLETVVNMDFPAAYVIKLEETASPNSSMNSLFQEVNERFAVILEVDNSIKGGGDRRGQGAIDQVDALKFEVFASILNWRITERATKGIQYDGAHVLDFDRARLWYQLEFSLETTIDSDDGFIVPSTPLTEIDFSDPNIPPLPTQKIFIPHD